MKILIICGSPRKNSLTRVLTDLAYTYAKEKYADAQMEYLDNLQKIKYIDQDD